MLYIELTLAGILMSFGTAESAWIEVCDTCDYPTVSMLAGLLAACLGIKKGTEEYDSLLNLSYLYKNNNELTAFQLDDFQIIRAKEPRKTYKDSAFLKIAGGKQEGGRPIHKKYLQDAEFSVLVGSSDETLLKTIHYATKHPKWVYFLGRACCTPKKPLSAPEFEAKPLEEWIQENNSEGMYMPCSLQ